MNATLQTVSRKTSPSCPIKPAEAVAPERLCGEIILQVTPPAELAAAVSAGLMPSCSAVVFCKLQNGAFADESLPVKKIPSQPMIGEKKGKSIPVALNAMPLTGIDSASSYYYVSLKSSTIFAKLQDKASLKACWYVV